MEINSNRGLSPGWVITSAAASVSGSNNSPVKLDPEIIKLSADDRKTIFGNIDLLDQRCWLNRILTPNRIIKAKDNETMKGFNKKYIGKGEI